MWVFLLKNLSLSVLKYSLVAEKYSDSLHGRLGVSSTNSSGEVRLLSGVKQSSSLNSVGLSSPTLVSPVSCLSYYN